VQPKAHHLNWAFSSMGCPEHDLESLLNLAHQFGFEHIELRCVGGCLDLPGEFALHPAGCEQGLRHIEESGVRVPVLASGLNLVSPAFGDSVVAWAELADALQSPWVRVFGDGGSSGTPSEQQWQMILSNLAFWRQCRSQTGFKSELLVETHDLFATTGSCQQLFVRLGHGVPLLWDIQHTGGTHGEPPRETWEALGPWVQHVHVSDRSCLGSPFEIVLPGSGVLPVIETLEILANAQFEGVVSLEWEKLWHPEIPSLEEALHAARKHWFALEAGTR